MQAVGRLDDWVAWSGMNAALLISNVSMTLQRDIPTYLPKQ